MKAFNRRYLSLHFLEKNKYPLSIVGLPKTVDNDIVPIHCSLGAHTAAEQGAVFFEHIVHEHSANPKMLVIHEVMGRHCGWLTYQTARIYTERLAQRKFAPSLGISYKYTNKYPNAQESGNLLFKLN